MQLIIPKGLVVKDMLRAVAKKNTSGKPRSMHRFKFRRYLRALRKLWRHSDNAVRNSIIMENMGYKLY